MKKYLVKIKEDYAAEFDIHGIILLDIEEREDPKTHLKKLLYLQWKNIKEEEFTEEDFQEYLAEVLPYEEFYLSEDEFLEDMEDIVDRSEVKQITPMEYTMLKNLFGTRWGHTLNI